ncbi:MAG TPA: phosphatase PAP2 family protein [Acidimicrobiales bacterium]|nr:phosphatase PAP2 family protein [Acidimicrobiales bacterium]
MPLTFRLPRNRITRAVDAFDAEVDAWFDHLRGNPVADRVFYAASALGDHGLIWLILGALRGLRGSDHDWHAAVRVGAGVGIESAVVNLGIKSLFRRKRPVFDGARPLALRTPRTSSFPSGHATSAFTAAGLLSEDDDLWPIYYAIALVVAWSRVHVKIHHASDVVAGIAVGIALGRLGRRLRPLPFPPDAGGSESRAPLRS